MKSMFIVAASIAAITVVLSNYDSFGEEGKRSMPPTIQLNSSSKVEREKALADAIAARKESVRIAVSIIESWERTRPDAQISSSGKPPEYVALRLLVEFRAVEALPILLRNVGVIDVDNPTSRLEKRPLMESFPFAAAVSELGTSSVTPLLDFMGKTQDRTQLQLAVVCLRSILGKELSLAAIDLRIREKGGPESADAKLYNIAKRLHETPGVMANLILDGGR